MLRALAAVAVAAVVVPSASAAPTGFSFGRLGGNIQPFTVVISANGAVRTTGPVSARTTPLSAQELQKLDRLAVAVRFAKLAKTTNCSGTNPDVAATFIHTGQRTVRVHGGCVAAYQKLWAALYRAAQVS